MTREDLAAIIEDGVESHIGDLIDAGFAACIGALGDQPEETSPDDAAKIRIAEQWRRGEISEDEARQQFGDDTVDGMIEDREAFREAMRRDTSDFLQSE
ncbi:hypothetical protein [Halovenus amylolytica]|uniref:hypothetical protein n=1 Tax=Halovenus amylolytica TaxID=2500550 RepID=UPI00360E05A9